MPEKQQKPASSEKKHETSPSTANSPTNVVRFRIPERLEHWIFMISFTTLALTGMVRKYGQTAIARAIVSGLGGIENVRAIHHVAARIMMLVVVYHLGEIIYKMYVQRKRPTLLPNLIDIKAAWQTIKYNTFRSNTPPQRRFSFEEKMEYWAVVWGTVVVRPRHFIGGIGEIARQG